MAKQKKPIGTEGPRNYQPFRYPGGKSKLAANPVFRTLLDSILLGADTFYEGFLGSAAITLDIAIRYPNMKFVGVDRDVTISGFWQLIAEGTEDQVQTLLALIAQTPTVDMFRGLRARGEAAAAGTEPPLSLVECAYHAIFFNRTTFSGISMAQPIGGFNQTSKWTITCRYNAPLLQQKVKKLRALFAGRLTVVRGDVLTWLDSVPARAPLYLDAPYFVKGDALYPERMDEFQHGVLADKLATRTNWIASYDICDHIREQYAPFAQLLEIDFRYSINGEKTSWKSSKEFLLVSPEVNTQAAKAQY